MNVIRMNKFGEFLTSRENGMQAYILIKKMIQNASPEDPFLVDFGGVKVLTPSYCDEVFGNLEKENPKKLKYDKNLAKSLRTAFDVIAETRDLNFRFETI